MASPAVESICCWRNSTHHSSLAEEGEIHRDIDIYNGICVVASSLSILGAIYQLLPKRFPGIPRGQREQEAYLRQNMLICWLAFADLLASIGILLRSAVWLADLIPLQDDISPAHGRVLCVALSAWIQFFYLSTYMWTLCYALDIHLIIKEKECPFRYYHALCWLAPLALSITGLTTLYYPSIYNCEHTYAIINYLTVYVPILAVMVINPILFTRSYRSASELLRSRGQFTNQERLVLDNLKEKFTRVMIVFYVCWIPNIMNGIFLLCKRSLPFGLLIATWMTMAILNPLQAFLNSLVYRGSLGCRSCLISQESPRSSGNISSLDDSTDDTSPLLSFRSRPRRNQ